MTDVEIGLHPVVFSPCDRHAIKLDPAGQEITRSLREPQVIPGAVADPGKAVTQGGIEEKGVEGDNAEPDQRSDCRRDVQLA
ncbi:MAG: hypothetical protein WBB85_02330 [Albidovulum sp.]|uniref:hypothetical protein n=1 Tax=Albidovulum sp. TaxID=1872424 RepID=UPI003CB147C9